MDETKMRILSGIWKLVEWILILCSIWLWDIRYFLIAGVSVLFRMARNTDKEKK